MSQKSRLLHEISKAGYSTNAWDEFDYMTNWEMDAVMKMFRDGNKDMAINQLKHLGIRFKL